ncbi:MAG: hypothetical protein H6631_02930 [Anaerolineaceae bacterium]|nr:hypothetical protein [Anaerolineaceae bacterium]
MKLNLILLIFGVLPVSLLCSLSEFIQNYGMASEESAAAAQPVEQAPTETGVKAESTATEPPLAPTDTTAPSVQVEAEPTITPTEAAPPTEAPSVAEQNSAPNVITWSGEDQPIAYGDTAQGTIAQIGDRHTYVFEGQEGEHVTASLKANRFKLYLMRPDERVWDCPTLNSDCLIDNVELPETGQYTLIVDGDGKHVGDYTVTLVKNSH